MNKPLRVPRPGSQAHIQPTTVVVICFASLIAIGTMLLMLPISSVVQSKHGGHPILDGGTRFLDALFTATSASCLTGLVTVDTGKHWSGFGQFVIVLLIQLGGLGFMTIASIFGLFVAGRMGLRRRASATVEGRGIDMGEVSWVVRATILFTLVTELVVAVTLAVHFWTKYGYSPKRAIWEGIFLAISGFNNAGFALYSDNVIGFNTDAWVLLPLAFALMVGGLGFPVLLEIWRHLKSRLLRMFGPQVLASCAVAKPVRWSLTTRFTLKGTALLVAVGTLMVGLAEWKGALKGLNVPAKLLNAFFAGVSPRTAGFNAVDYADFHPSTLLGTDLLMFIGGGSGGTAGGVKITTAAVILAAVIAEVRADSSVAVSNRRIGPPVVRQSLAVLAFGVALVMTSILIILFLAPQFTTDQIAFEVTSAFATVGLSTGITGYLPAGAQIILIVLMFAGRVGPIVLATALASRARTRVFEYPEERPFIG